MVSFWKIKACSFNLFESFGTSKSCQEEVPWYNWCGHLQRSWCRPLSKSSSWEAAKGHEQGTCWEAPHHGMGAMRHPSAASPSQQRAQPHSQEHHWQAWGEEGCRVHHQGQGRGPEGKGRRNILTWTQRDSTEAQKDSHVDVSSNRWCLCKPGEPG